MFDSARATKSRRRSPLPPLVPAILLHALSAAADERGLPSEWQGIAAPGAAVSAISVPGSGGAALRIDFDFRRGGGEVMAHKSFPLTLPENYVLSFSVRGEGFSHGLEVRLVDESGRNVWRFYDAEPRIGAAWRAYRIKRRRFEFAWGPAAGGHPSRLGMVEFVIPRGAGGKGSLWIDNLRLEPRQPDVPYAGTPTLSASGTGQPVPALLDEGNDSPFRQKEGAQWLQADFGSAREYGGLVVDWAGDDFATAYTVQHSDDGHRWQTAYEVVHGNGGRDYLPLPESESRYLRLVFRQSSRGNGYAVRRLQVQPLAFSRSPQALFQPIAREAPPGFYPRYFSGQQVYWTMVGSPGSEAAGAACEGLLSEDGMLETHAGAFSLEPFLFEGGHLHTWADGPNTPSLEQGHLPIPSVRWERGPLSLTVTALAEDTAKGCGLFARYRVENHSPQPVRAHLFVALRPFLVTPPWQALPGAPAVAPIHRLSYRHGVFAVDGRRQVLSRPAPDRAGVGGFDGEPLAALLAQGIVPARTDIHDGPGFASAALQYRLSLGPGESREVTLSMPPADGAGSAGDWERRHAQAVRRWQGELDRLMLRLPPGQEALAAALKSNLAYILIHRDGAALRPGSRRYGRTWIRDAAVTSASLLALGHAREVRAFLQWYAGYQKADGSVPCCLDPWGPDAMIEHDSAGEFLYTAASYFDYTGDRPFLRRLWPGLQRAAEYLGALRAQRLGERYLQGDEARFRGLLPESASHEGYMARPVHSYWDDFWALRGLDDAARLAAALGRDQASRRYAAWRDGLREDLYRSIAATREKFSLDYVPGSAELGDYDPTSTAVAATVAGEAAGPLRDGLLSTYRRFDSEIRDRLQGKSHWQAYAPYELRNVSALVRLGEREAAWRALDFLFQGRRPLAWNQWPEVVWRDPAAPQFIGDMPHSWIGAEFIQALLSLFAYRDGERLVLGAGLPAAWLEAPDGIGIDGLATPFGRLGYRIEPAGPGRVRMRIDKGVEAPGGMLVALPGMDSAREITINGREVAPGVPVIVARGPAYIVIRR